MEPRALHHLARRLPLPRLRPPQPPRPNPPRHHSTSTTPNPPADWPQAKPLGAYYESLLAHPLSGAFTADPHPPPPPTRSTTQKEENIARARVV